ncbi:MULTISPECIES: hypothetical protein [Actinoalloteichus]|uniref:Uncharacterized protein n=1 Tax=Actinoalloteichus fjordicus TaxID=1612552 RepID=A0AAC9LB79_9PSEU|nr:MULTISPECIES: hypothetical protein [Actinoalloteichus]APU13734.1 hypothetical protein UA74_08340 [Actinoalloteichus fjordicus]APU19680.1 hypothetical protein UA75_08320 [Actinoalloteichus sp. GBA129-24]
MNAVSAGVLLLAVSACADTGDDVGYGGTPSAEQAETTESNSRDMSSPEIPPIEEAPADAAPVATERVDSSALPDDYPVEVWTSEDGTVVGANGQEGGCTVVSAELAEETAESVTIALVETGPGEEAVCTMDIRIRPVSVELAEPIGERTVILEAS